MQYRRFKSRQSKSFRLKRQIRKIIMSGVFVIVLALIAFLLSYLSSLSALAIGSVQISGADKDQSEAIHSLAFRAMEGKYLGIFPRSNMFIYPKSAIQGDIQKTFPDIMALSIQRTGRTLTVAVTGKTPSALICNTLPDFDGNDLSLDNPGSCYFADNAGLIFKKSPSFSGNPYNRYYAPDLASTSIIGSYATSTDEFSALQKFYDRVKNNNIVVDAILIKGSNEYELYAKNPKPTTTSANPGSGASTAVVYFNDSLPLEEQLSNLVSFWTNMTNGAKAKNNRLEFEYIDLRYGANIFYREVK